MQTENSIEIKEIELNWFDLNSKEFIYI